MKFLKHGIKSIFEKYLNEYFKKHTTYILTESSLRTFKKPHQIIRIILNIKKSVISRHKCPDESSLCHAVLFNSVSLKPFRCFH